MNKQSQSTNKQASIFDYTESDDLFLTLPEDCINILQDANSADVAIFVEFWSACDCKNAPNALFVFGDNDIHEGIGGQAVIRNCKNSIGIPTKKQPNNYVLSFYTDSTYYENCQKIYDAVSNLIRESTKYKEIMFPKDGFGTGLAKLHINAPKTLAYLEKLLNDSFGIDYKLIRTDGIQIEYNLPKNLNVPKLV